MTRPLLLAVLAALSCAPPAGARQTALSPDETASGERAIYMSAADAAEPWHEGWADARRSGDLVFVSGVIVAPDPAHPLDLERAFSRAFGRIEQTLLASGSSMAGIVDVTAYLTDVTTQTEALNKARLGFMKPPFAASTVVQVARLIPAAAIGEIRVVARVGKGK